MLKIKNPRSTHYKNGIYKISSKKVPFGLKKGEFYYRDKLHNDHVEVYDKKGNAKSVLNIDGTINIEKTQKAINEKRTINIE